MQAANVFSSSFTTTSSNDLSAVLSDAPALFTDEPVLSNTAPPTTEKKESKGDAKGVRITATMVSSLVVIPLGVTEINWHQCHITLDSREKYKHNLLPEDVNKLLKSISPKNIHIAKEDKKDLATFGCSLESADDILTNAFAQKL